MFLSVDGIDKNIIFYQEGKLLFPKYNLQVRKYHLKAVFDGKK